MFVDLLRVATNRPGVKLGQRALIQASELWIIQWNKQWTKENLLASKILVLQWFSDSLLEKLFPLSKLTSPFHGLSRTAPSRRRSESDCVAIATNFLRSLVNRRIVRAVTKQEFCTAQIA